MNRSSDVMLIIRKILSVAGTERHLKTRKAISIGCQLCFIVKSVCSAGAYESFRCHLPLIGDGAARAESKSLNSAESRQNLTFFKVNIMLI